MRRTPLCAAASVILLLASCGGDDDDSTAETRITAPATTTTTEPARLEKPTVEVPDAIPTELGVTVLMPGTGPAAASGDTVVVDYVGVRTETGEEFDESYGRNEPFPVVLGSGGVIEGWDTGLVGAQTGSRIQLDIPSDQAYGDEANGIIQPGDALTFVIDVRAVVPAAAQRPPLDGLTSSGAAGIEVEDLVPGNGAEATPASWVVFHAVVLRGDTGEEIDDTWSSGQPVALQLAGDTIESLVTGMPGMKVGGRRAITAPAGMAGLDATAMEQRGIPADADVVFVVDLFGTY